MKVYFPFGAFFVNVIFAVLPFVIFTYFFFRAFLAFEFFPAAVSLAPLSEVTLTVVFLPFFTVFLDAFIVAFLRMSSLPPDVLSVPWLSESLIPVDGDAFKRCVCERRQPEISITAVVRIGSVKSVLE